MKERYEKGELAKEILTNIALAGMVVVCFTLPGMTFVLKWFSPKSQYEREKIKRAVRDMEKREVIRIYRKDGQDVIEMLEKGKERILRYKFDDIHIIRPKHWNKRWYLITFDFPSRFDRERRIFRDKLYQLGFVQYQKSVFVIPYECKDEILFIAGYLGLEQYVKYVTAESIDGSKMFERIFKLPRK